MKEHVYSVKAKSQAANIRVKYIMTTQKRPKLKENQVGILGISPRELMHYFGNSAESLGSRRECCWGYVSIFENFSLIYWCV